MTKRPATIKISADLAHSAAHCLFMQAMDQSGKGYLYTAARFAREAHQIAVLMGDVEMAEVYGEAKVNMEIEARRKEEEKAAAARLAA